MHHHVTASFAVDLREDIAADREGDLQKHPSQRPLASLWKRGTGFVITILIAGGFASLCIIAPRRFINTITVVKGGFSVRFKTYTAFGTRMFEGIVCLTRVFSSLVILFI